MATRNLLVRAGFDASGMARGTRQANNALKQFGQAANKQMSSLSNSLSSSLGKIGKLLAGAFAIGAIVRFGKECIELGSDLAEVQNVVDVTFGSMSEDVNKFAKTAITQFGLSETSAKQYTSTMGAMLKSMGLTTKEALVMSKTITGLSADMASFYNLDADVAFEKIRSGISGETEPLKQLGINMSVANMQAYAMSQGISKAYSKMTQQEQALLRYNYLLSVTADAQGDFARTSDQWANQTRILAEQFNALKAEIGQGLIAAFTPVIKVLNFLVSKLRVAASYFRAFMELIFGKQSVSGGDSGMSEVVDSTGAIADSAGDASDSVSGIGDAAKEAAKKAKGALASFDELNVIGTNDSSSSSNGSGSGGSGISSSGSGGVGDVDLGSVDTTTTVLDGFAEKLEEIFGKFASIDLQPLVESFERFKKALEPITQKLFAGLMWGLENVIYPLSKWTIEDAIPAFLDVLSGALTVLNPLLESFKPLASFLWDNFLVPIASWTGGIIVATLEGLAKVLTSIGNWMSDHIEIVSAITTTLALFFGAWKIMQLMAFIQMSGGVVAAISAITTAIKAGIVAKIADKVQTLALTALYAKDFVVAVASSTAALIKQAAQFVLSKVAMVATTVAQAALTVATVAWNAVCVIATTVTTAFGAAIAFLTSPIGLVVLAIAALVAGIILLIKNWDSVKEAGTKCGEAIKQAWNKFSDWFNTTVIQPTAKFFSDLWNGIMQSAANAWTNVCSAWKSAGQWFDTNIIQPIKNKFTTWKTDISNLGSQAWSGVKTGWNNATQWFNTTIITPITTAFSKLWNGIKSGASTAFNEVGTSAKNGMNWVISHINSMITKINSKLSFTLPDFFGGGKVGFSIPQIPKLAKGGVLRQSTIVEAGEYPGARQNPEIVTPQNLMYDTVVSANAELAVSFFQAARMIVGAIENKDLNVTIGDDAIGRSSVNYINKQTKLKGMSPIIV